MDFYLLFSSLLCAFFCLSRVSSRREKKFRKFGPPFERERKKEKEEREREKEEKKR